MREEIGGSRGGRQTMGLDPGDREFDRRFRFGFTLEHADVFRTLTFGWRGLARTMPLQPAVTGPLEPGLCYFFSFNQGLPALAQLRMAGFKVYMVYRALNQRPAGVGWMRYGYMRLRLRMLAKVCGAAGIGTGGSRERIVQSIAEGGLVTIAVDTPPLPGNGVVEIEFPGGRRAWWRTGVLKLALELGGPQRCFIVHVDWKTGARTVELRQLEPRGDLAGLARMLNQLFLELYHYQPELWFHWPAPQGFLIAPASVKVET